MERYSPTIGLEIHAELKTRTKMFCANLNDPDESHPNINICPVCTGHPGTLPSINAEAIRKLILVGLALNCEIALFSKFDRKNYFYPDLPKGYQISQYDKPLCSDGWLEIKVGSPTEIRRIRIERVHMEEDTAKSFHADGDASTLVDFNRAGIPLMELVTRPDLTSGPEIEAFAKELRLILRYLDVSDADMEKGQMRVEVNVSVRRADSQSLIADSSHKDAGNEPSAMGHKLLGTKVEVKNINSINAAARSADYEIRRQKELLDSGGTVVQETRGWDDAGQRTYSQRVKEGSADYRYFPEPDLPPLVHTAEQIKLIGSKMPELPAQRRIRFRERYRLTDSQIEVFTTARHLGDYFEQAVSEIDAWDKLSHLIKPDHSHMKRIPILAANYIITEFPQLAGRGLDGGGTGDRLDSFDDYLEGFSIKPVNFADLIVRIFHDELSSSAAKTVLRDMAQTGESPDAIIKRRDLKQVSDIGELETVVAGVLASNAKAIEDYKKGKQESLKFLIGRVMAQTKGKANPVLTEEIIKNKLTK